MSMIDCMVLLWRSPS